MSYLSKNEKRPGSLGHRTMRWLVTYTQTGKRVNWMLLQNYAYSGEGDQDSDLIVISVPGLM
jgi:hypothetical protein